MTIKILAAGHTCLDIVHYVSALPDKDTKIPSDRLNVQLGGNAGNFAVALSELGADVDLCCVLGSKYDPITDSILTLARSRNLGLDCGFIESEKSPVSSVIILPNGDRILTSYQPKSIMDATCNIPTVTQYDMVFSDSYRLPLAREVFAEARKHKVPTMLDIDKAVPNVYDLPASSYMIFSNESYTAMNLTENDLPSLQQHFGGVVGYTASAGLIRYADKNGVYQFQPDRIENPVTTLGAGDTYRAALAMHLCYGKDIHTAIKLACNSAYEHILEKTLTKITGDMK